MWAFEGVGVVVLKFRRVRGFLCHSRGQNQFTAFPLCMMKECELKIGWNPKENRKGRLARLLRGSQGISLESPFALRGDISSAMKDKTG